MFRLLFEQVLPYIDSKQRVVTDSSLEPSPIVTLHDCLVSSDPDLKHVEEALPVPDVDMLDPKDTLHFESMNQPPTDSPKKVLKGPSFSTLSVAAIFQ